MEEDDANDNRLGRRRKVNAARRRHDDVLDAFGVGRERFIMMVDCRVVRVGAVQESVNLCVVFLSVLNDVSMVSRNSR